jgi:hypothetical protein
MKIKQNYLKVGLVLTALTLLPLAYPAMAGDLVPFKGKEAGVITSLSFHFPFDVKSQTAEGEATQVGHYTLTGSFVVDVRFGTGAGTFTMTAANGDLLFLDMEAHVIPTDLTKTVSTYTVTGGTGRFAGLQEASPLPINLLSSWALPPIRMPPCSRGPSPLPARTRNNSFLNPGNSHRVPLVTV